MRVLLLLSKVPQFRGMGSNMRAGAHVASLAKCSELCAVVASYEPLLGLNDVITNLTRAPAEIKYFSSHSRKSRTFYESTRSRSGLLRLGRRLLSGPRETVGLEPREVRLIASSLAEREFDVVMAFRLSMAPAALQLRELLGRRGKRPAAILDLDDIDSLRMSRTASVGQSGRLWSSMERLQARHVRRRENRFIPLFDRVYVCSDVDADLLNRRYASRHVHVLPNAVSVPDLGEDHRRAEGATIGFVGSMDYVPNADAVIHFCNDILPAIQAELRRPVRFVIVGRNPPPAVAELSRKPGVEVTGTVEEVAPFYQSFDLAVAPLRSGGGTRIKILEAFGFERAVVATSVGAEGIDARDGESIFIADDASSFAARCVQLLNDPALRDELGRAGRRLVVERYSMEAIGHLMQRSLSDLLNSRTETRAEVA